MKSVFKISAIALGMTLAACGGETSASGGAAVGDAEVDTSQNWVEVVSKTEDGGYVMGNPDAPIKVVEYASLTCPACAAFSEQSHEPMMENYISQGLVSFEIRNFVRDPLDLSAALLARCNGEGPFFQLNQRLFMNQDNMFQTIQTADQARLQALSTPEALQSGQTFVGFAEASGLIELVGGMGISDQQARQCLTDSAAIQELDEVRNRALNQLNITSTPSFLINGELVSGVSSWAQLDARLQEMVQ
ncbi:thioredoxin domain-containing protein [Parasphingopyxis sp.]|uniref:thioredoxin domain-containing protein n=1 Tax=Parasphingopyxis sp. TaxID=1920299 RepID=UPI0026067384|nr:thioredoxin domain-containing protein [Parasphingopyxis sp.]